MANQASRPQPERQPAQSTSAPSTSTPSTSTSSAGTVPFPDDVVHMIGRGVIYKDGERLGEAGYDLMIVPPHRRGAVLESGTPPVDRPDISGTLTDSMLLGEAIHGGRLTLALEDGHRFEFTVIVPETNEILGVNWLHD
jgi:hypothetical protein